MSLSVQHQEYWKAKLGRKLSGATKTYFKVLSHNVPIGDEKN